VVGVVDLGPGRSNAIVVPEEPVGAVDRPDQEDRRMGLAGGGLAEPHRPHGFVHAGDGGHAGPRVGEAVEGTIGGNPEFPRLPKNGPGNDPLSIAVGVAPIHRDRVHLAETGPAVGAAVDSHRTPEYPLAGSGGIEGGRAGTVGGHGSSAGKPGTGGPTPSQGGGVGRRPVAGKRRHHHSGPVGGDRHRFHLARGGIARGSAAPRAPGLAVVAGIGHVGIHRRGVDAVPHPHHGIGVRFGEFQHVEVVVLGVAVLARGRRLVEVRVAHAFHVTQTGEQDAARRRGVHVEGHAFFQP